MERDCDYEKNNVGYDAQYPDGGIKCKNYLICGSVLPEWWFYCKSSYLCTICHIMFGTWSHGTGKGILEIIDKIECPICLESRKGISQPRCEHSVCITCFKRCYFGDESNEGEPIFPYSGIEDEYQDEPQNPKWDNDYPLIKIYNEEHDKWEDEKNEKYENEAHLRKCPLCRK